MTHRTGAVPPSRWENDPLERLRTRLLDPKLGQIGSESEQRSLSVQPSVDPDDLPDEIDVAASEHSKFVVFRTHERGWSLLGEMKAALRRIANGTFGTCDRCGQEIPPERLEAPHMMMLCVDCQEEEEIELRREAMLRRHRTS